MRRRKPISETEWAIFKFIVQFKVDHDGNAPTLREIGQHIGKTSTSMIVFHLTRLCQAKLIRYSGFRNRNIEIIGGRYIVEELQDVQLQ